MLFYSQLFFFIFRLHSDIFDLHTFINMYFINIIRTIDWSRLVTLEERSYIRDKIKTGMYIM
jgi:hypothetical protein